MSYGNEVPLTKINSGQSGTVSEIKGGSGMRNRLDALGIRPGVEITKISSMLMRGPVTIQIGRARVAIGFGMASRIMVKPG